MSKKRKLRQTPTPLLIHLGLCPGAQPLLVTEYAERITGAWHKSVDSVFEMSRLCAEADQRLNDDDKKELIARLPFDRTRFVKLAKIGRDQRLQDPQIRLLLPDHHTMLYELAGLTDDELRAAVDTKIVHPEMKRAALTAWVKDRRGQGGRADEKNAETALPKGIHLAVRLPRNMPDDAVERFEGELLTLCEVHGVDIVYPKSKILADKREQNRRYRRHNDHLVREARKIVQEMKRRQLKGRPRHVSSELWQRNRWPYAPEETRIDGPDEEQIRYALEILGRGDEFDRIRREAMRELF
jgi:hypothetical protein